MADAVLSFVIQKLGEQIDQEAELLCGARDDVVWIKDELQSMRAFLKDADQRREKDKGVEAWINQLRRVVFDAEDVVDGFMVQKEMQSRLRNGCMGNLAFYACFIKHLIAQHQFATQIQKIKKEVKEIHERSARYGFQTAYLEVMSSGVTDAGHPDPGVAAPWVEEADIVGLEKDAEQVQEWLLKEGDTLQQRTIISIVGMGGLGKTTLAKKVFKVIKMHFECYSWVYVSQSYEMKDLLKLILKGFCQSRKETPPGDMDTLREGEVRERTCNYLQGKRYALVLDDIWDIRVWENVKHALPCEVGGRIIFTTRIENVASPVGERCHIHKLEPLSRDLAWDLFCRKTFRDQSPHKTCPHYLIQVGEAMVGRCKGLPLAIVAIGGLMSRKKPNTSEWQEVLENLSWELSHNQELVRLNQVLLTSYNHLPPHLKYCFLYCAMFPEDHVIKRKKLIQMWVAEGFIEEHPRKTLEEVSSDYFVQLIDRNLLQPVLQERTGELIACQVHDLMRDIAIHMFKKEEFAAIITNQNTNFEERIRRLALQNDKIDIPGSTLELNPRSLLMFNENEFPSSPFCRMLSAFKLLRVLDLGGTKIKDLPNEVGDLIHLRYLSLRRTKVENLPTSLKRLHNLQTLDVRECGMTSFPAGIMKLFKLRHLLVVNCHRCPSFEKPNEARNLRHIQTLSGVAVDDSLSRELGYLPQLRKLRIGRVRGEHCEQLCNSIIQLQQLGSLKIESLNENEQLRLEALTQPPQYLEKLYLRGVIKELPKWVVSLSCLRVIVFEGSQFIYDPLPTLGQLPNLVYISLKKTYTGRQIGCTPGGFPKLRSMVIKNLEELEDWNAIEDCTMQSLQYLYIASCPKLKMLPDGLQHLTTLQKLYLESMPEEFAKRVRSCGDDHFKVQHIPIIKHFHQVDGEYVFELLSRDGDKINFKSGSSSGNWLHMFDLQQVVM